MSYQRICKHEAGHVIVARHFGLNPRSFAASNDGSVLHDSGTVLQNAAVAVAGKLAELADDLETAELRVWFDARLRENWQTLSSADRITIRVCSPRQQWEATQLAYKILTERRRELEVETELIVQQCREHSDLDPYSSRAAADEFLANDRERRREEVMSAQTKEALRQMDDFIPTPPEYNHSAFLKLVVLNSDPDPRQGYQHWIDFVRKEAAASSGRPEPSGLWFDQTHKFLERYVESADGWKHLGKQFNNFVRERGQGAQ